MEMHFVHGVYTRSSLRSAQMIFSATKNIGKGDRRAHWIRITHYRTHTTAAHRFHFILFFKRKKVRKHAPRPDCQMLIRMGCCISATTTYEIYGISIQCDVCCAASIHLVHSPNRSCFFPFMWRALLFFFSAVLFKKCLHFSTVFTSTRNAFVPLVVCDLIAAVRLHNRKITFTALQCVMRVSNGVGKMKGKNNRTCSPCCCVFGSILPRKMQTVEPNLCYYLCERMCLCVCVRAMLCFLLLLLFFPIPRHHQTTCSWSKYATHYKREVFFARSLSLSLYLRYCYWIASKIWGERHI